MPIGQADNLILTIEREAWINAFWMLGRSDGASARRRAMRQAFREMRRGDCSSARIWYRTAWAIMWLSNPTTPRHMRPH